MHLAVFLYLHTLNYRVLHCIGLEDLEKVVAKWKADPSKYSPTEMRACLDGFKDVLFQHLDEEVRTLLPFAQRCLLTFCWVRLQVEDLRGQNLKKYMTMEQLATIPI